MTREDVEDVLAVAHAALVDHVSKDDLPTVVMAARREPERAILAGMLDRPAGEGARDFGDVVLRVPAVHAERVELHQLAAVVLIQAVFAPAAPVVEVEEHRRTLRGRAEQIAKPSEHARPDDVALVRGEQHAIGALACVDVEVVEPEIHQHFLQLPVAVDGAENFLLLELDDRLL